MSERGKVAGMEELLEVLTRIAEALEANARETERLARYLGDAVSVHDGQLRVRIDP